MNINARNPSFPRMQFAIIWSAVKAAKTVTGISNLVCAYKTRKDATICNLIKITVRHFG